MLSIPAKSPYAGHQITLVQHTQHVVTAVGELFGTVDRSNRLAQCWLRFFKVDDFEAFLIAATAAAALHDIGKANEDFVRAVNGARDGQLLRHEHLSGLLMTLPMVADWLRRRNNIDWDVVLSAVVCHHLKADPDELASPQADRPSLVVLADHPEFRELLAYVGRVLEIEYELPEIPTRWSLERRPDSPKQSILKQRDNLIDRLIDFGFELEEDEPRERLLRAVRAALIQADAVGSGLPRAGKKMTDWSSEVFDETDLRTDAYVYEAVIDPRIKELTRKNRWTEWSRFQEHTAELPDRALLLAPCGSGKTLAAWRWIAHQAKRGVRHCLFLYPTRATATEGFKDYVSWAPEDHAALMHGTAGYELEGMFANPEDDDPRSGKQYEPQQRLYALGYWQKRVFSATVDQFLAFLQYGYASVCMLPVLADSVVVVDEVHSFDPSMFRGLVDVLNNFDVPVLCMTATLPKDRRRQLEHGCGVHVLDACQEDFPDLRRIAEAPRYCVTTGTQEHADTIVRDALGDDKKVLWVVNTVARSQQIARRFAVSPTDSQPETAEGVPLFCYHSRFRLCDRKHRHDNVIEAFHPRAEGAALAITTQVCEMGLDLDADLLVTERAPITAVIQRMGRCNRSREPRADAGDVFVYCPDDPKPYGPEELEGVQEFLEKLTSFATVSQAELDAALREAPTRKEPPKATCLFLRSGPFALSGVEMFRDIEQFSRPSVLHSDLSTVLDRRAAGNPIDGYVLPVPRQFRQDGPAGLPRHLGVARSNHYLLALGYCDEPNTAGDPPPCPETKPPLIV